MSPFVLSNDMVLLWLAKAVSAFNAASWACAGVRCGLFAIFLYQSVYHFVAQFFSFGKIGACLFVLF